jgi:hypothetical protein
MAKSKNSKNFKNYKSLLYIIPITLALVFFAWMVTGVAPFDRGEGGGMKVQLPPSGSNNSTSIFFNVSYMNGTNITDPRNASFWYNLSGVWTLIGNTSGDDSGFGACFVSSCNVTLPINQLVDGYYSINVTLDNGTENYTAVSISDNANLSHEILFDSTGPNVTASNFASTLKAGDNRSGSFLANITIEDTFRLVETVLLNITNTTSRHNVTYGATNLTAVVQGGVYWNVTINTSHYEEGPYNISIIANDSDLNNINASIDLLELIYFDNTKPLSQDDNFSVPASGDNFSQALNVNISVIDELISIETVVFNITNESGLQNATYVASKEGATNYYNFSINTTNFAEGIYNITALVNDTAGNTNNTAFSGFFRIDNTAPNVSNANNLAITSGDNRSTDFLLNLSVADAFVGLDAVFLNITNVTGLQNATHISTSLSGNFYNFTINSTNFPDGLYNLTVWANDTANNINNTDGALEVYFDNTKPAVVTANFSEPVPGENVSSTLNITIAVFDTGASVETVIFNISNATGSINLSTTGARFAATDEYNVSVNSLILRDGTYNITAIVNDTAGNVNDSALSTVFTIDNTNPSGSLSCTPDPVGQGETITCTCSSSDATSKVKTESNTLNPSTALSGKFTTECDVTDYAGNTLNLKYSYTVDSGTGGSGSGSSGGRGGSGGGTVSKTTWKSTTEIEDSVFQDAGDSGVTRELAENERAQFNFGGETHYVGVILVSESSAQIEVGSTPQKISIGVGSLQKFELTGDNYYDLSVGLNSVEGGRASLTMLLIHEEISEGDTGLEIYEPKEGVEKAEEGLSAGIIITIIVIILLLAVAAFILYKKKKR